MAAKHPPFHTRCAALYKMLSSLNSQPCFHRSDNFLPSFFLSFPFPTALGFLRPAMAESAAQFNETEMEQETPEMEKLRYLEIVHLAAIRAVLCASSLYLYAKENAGPLRNGVESVEGTVKAVVGPVYDRYQALPFDLLKIADRKVGESVLELERHVPEGMKDAYVKAQKAPEVARSIADEVQRAGVVGTVAVMAKATCVRVEPAAERLALSTWQSLNRLPVFPQVARTVVPAAADLSKRYNHAVSCAAEKGYSVSAYFPLVPTERIAKIFDVAEAE